MYAQSYHILQKSEHQNQALPKWAPSKIENYEFLTCTVASMHFCNGSFMRMCLVRGFKALSVNYLFTLKV